MSEVLSFKRLGLLIRRYWAENARFFLLGTIALFGLMALVLGVWVVGSGTSYHEDETWAIFLVGLFVTGAIFASTAFSPLSDKARGIYWLSIPASHLEKLIVTILFHTVFFIVVYCACFFTLQRMVLAYLESGMHKEYGAHVTYMDWKNDPDNWEMARYFTMAFLAVQALFLLGSIYFRRFAFVKTVISGSVFVFLFIWMMMGISKHFYPPGVNWNVFELRQYGFTDGTPTKVYKVPELSKDFTFFMFRYMWAPVFWVIAWFRLKEAEV